MSQSLPFSNIINVPHRASNAADELAMMLHQDGILAESIHVPPPASVEFAKLVTAAKCFQQETTDAEAWPMRSERWLNRLSVGLVGRPFWELSTEYRRAICHAVEALVRPASV
jgi:hypothetical protein